MSNSKFNVGDRVKSLDPQFEAMWLDKNVWAIDDVRENIGSHKVLYACHNVYDSGRTTYHFKEKDIELLI